MLAGSHPHVSAGTVALAVTCAAVIYVLVAIASPTRTCPRCGGDRIQFTRHWLTRRVRTRPCRRCSGTGRTPRFGGRTIHRVIWLIRQERKP